MNSRILPEPVLVGRERKIETLQQNLDLTVQGGTTVFISVEAGSGNGLA